MFDFCYDKHQESDIELLYEVTARHLVIMFRAFDNLQHYENGLRSQIIDTFLQKEVLEKSRWNEHEAVIDLESLKLGIGKYSELQNGGFRMKRREPLVHAAHQLNQRGI